MVVSGSGIGLAVALAHGKRMRRRCGVFGWAQSKPKHGPLQNPRPGSDYPPERQRSAAGENDKIREFQSGRVLERERECACASVRQRQRQGQKQWKSKDKVCR